MKSKIKQFAEALGYEVRGISMTPRQLRRPELARTLEFDDVICRRIVEKGPSLTFVQVGAFDGLVNDPLRKYIVRHGWRGVLVEPQPGPAQRLRELYQDNENIAVLQAALDRVPGTRPFFTVDAPEAPAWAGALASFDKAVILKHADIISGLERMIREVSVNCVTFEQVLPRLPKGDLDLLQVDTEGADALILWLFPFDLVRPAVVHWEVRHLSLAEREGCLGRLAGFGYRFAPSGSQDILAVLDGV